MSTGVPGFFAGTEMPTAGRWEALWPDPAGVLAANHRHQLRRASPAYLRSTKIAWQAAGPIFSALCDGVTGTSIAVPALVASSRVVPFAA
jgi:hypothetical protein